MISDRLRNPFCSSGSTTTQDWRSDESARDGQDSYGRKLSEEVCLHDQRGTRFALLALQSDDHQVATLQAVQPVVSDASHQASASA